MPMDNYENYLNQYIADQRKDLDKLESFRPNKFKHLHINCGELTEEMGNRIIDELVASGINKETSVLYFMKVIGDPKAILNKVTKLKSRKRNKMMLPMVNKEQFDTDTDILYIGKTNSNFLSRMSYHLGLKSQKTYALHLMHWAAELGLVVDLYYATVDIDKEDIRYLEQMESALHHCMKPLLGRSGH